MLPAIKKIEKNTVYIRHLKFLRPNHPYCRLRKPFNEKHEFGIAPKPLTDK